MPAVPLTVQTQKSVAIRKRKRFDKKFGLTNYLEIFYTIHTSVCVTRQIRIYAVYRIARHVNIQFCLEKRKSQMKGEKMRCTRPRVVQLVFHPPHIPISVSLLICLSVRGVRASSRSLSFPTGNSTHRRQHCSQGRGHSAVFST